MVTVTCRPRHCGQFAEVGAQPIDLPIDLLVGYRRVGDGDPEAVVAGNVDPGPDLDDGVEGDRACLLPTRDVNLGRGDHIHLVVPDGLGVVVGQGFPQGLLSRCLGAEPGLEDATGRLARPESGNADLAGDPAEGGIKGLLELLLVDLDRELHFVALEGLDDGLHGEGSVPGHPLVSYEMGERVSTPYATGCSGPGKARPRRGSPLCGGARPTGGQGAPAG